MIALTATPPKNALAVFGVRVDARRGLQGGLSPLEIFGYFVSGQSNCHRIKEIKNIFIQTMTGEIKNLLPFVILDITVSLVFKSKFSKRFGTFVTFACDIISNIAIFNAF